MKFSYAISRGIYLIAKEISAQTSSNYAQKMREVFDILAPMVSNAPFTHWHTWNKSYDNDPQFEEGQDVDVFADAKFNEENGIAWIDLYFDKRLDFDGTLVASVHIGNEEDPLHPTFDFIDEGRKEAEEVGSVDDPPDHIAKQIFDKFSVLAERVLPAYVEERVQQEVEESILDRYLESLDDW